MKSSTLANSTRALACAASAAIALVAMGLAAVFPASPAFADLTTTAAPAPPIAALGSGNPIDSLRASIQQLETQLTTLNGGPSQGPLPPGGDFAADLARQNRQLQLQQAQDNLTRLKAQLSKAEVNAALTPRTPTLIDTVLANYSSHQSLENKFRLELPACVQLSQDQTNHLGYLAGLADVLVANGQPVDLKLSQATDAVRAHFVKLRKAADPDILKSKGQLAPAPSTSAAAWQALMAEETQVKTSFEAALKESADKEALLQKTIRLRDKSVLNYAANLPNPGPGCTATPQRLPPSQHADEQAIYNTINNGHPPTPYAAADFDRSFYYIKATEAYGVSPGSLRPPSISGGAVTP